MKTIGIRLLTIVAAAFLISMAGCAFPWQYKTIEGQHEQELLKLKADQNRLIHEQVQLHTEVRNLKRLNLKYKNLVELQDRVLQLLDDRDNTVKTMLSEEAKKQNLIFQYSDIEQPQISFAESELFKTADTKISTRGRKRLKQIFQKINHAGVTAVVVENHFGVTTASRQPLKIQEMDDSLSFIRAAAVAKFIARNLELPPGGTIYCSFINPGLELATTDRQAVVLERRIEIIFELTQ